MNKKVSNQDRFTNAKDEYISLLVKHDWFYMMSDDPSVFREGQSSLSKVERAKKLLEMLDDGTNNAMEIAASLWKTHAKTI